MGILARLGRVFYIFCWVLALGFLGILVYGASAGTMYTGAYLVLGGCALLSVIIGRAVYYILAGL